MKPKKHDQDTRVKNGPFFNTSKNSMALVSKAMSFFNKESIGLLCGKVIQIHTENCLGGGHIPACSAQDIQYWECSVKDHSLKRKYGSWREDLAVKNAVQSGRQEFRSQHPRNKSDIHMCL